jgi:hypothetical protein
MMRIRASEPLREIPRWALLERELIVLVDRAWRVFEERFCEPDGRLRYRGRMYGRDGVDDFYEPFFNWPAFARLGGSRELLESAKRHWEGVTRQLTEFGFIEDEYEIGYDWFHQGESLGLFLGICAADPADERFRERARRFASLYLPGGPTGNYDADRRMIVAPHTGSGGPRWGVGEDWMIYSADQAGMEPYGLPLLDVEGIREWSDLRSPEAAVAMGQAMQERMGQGDTAVNLAATSLATNAWLYRHDPAFADWVLDYVDAWRERAAANGGVLPDNVGPSGVVGELHGGAWYGGHYGWTWPHGLHSVGAAAAIAALNASLITGEVERLDLVRGLLDAVLDRAVVADQVSDRGSLGPGWAEKLGVSPETPELLVPFRHGPEGWFDLNPFPLTLAAWLSWTTGTADDEARIRRLRDSSGSDWTTVRWFHDKEEQGHEAPWIEYLAGRNPDYPERGLELAIGQVLRRLALIAAAPAAPEDGDIHFWQRLNPVVTEVLTQLVTGAPPPLYYGGLAMARVTVADEETGRPGLPPDVAVLVTSVDDTSLRLTAVNLGDRPRGVILTAGGFGEDRIDEVRYGEGAAGYPGDPHSYLIPPTRTVGATAVVDSARLGIELPPNSQIWLELAITRRAYRPAHQNYSTIDQEKS